MTKKFKIFLAIVPISLTAVTLSIAAFSGKYLEKSSAADTSYQLTLNSNNAPAGLTSNYQKSVSSTVTTAQGNNLTFTLTNAKSLSNGYAALGSRGSIYCISSGSDHISGLKSVRVTYSGGTLTLKSSSVNTTDGSSYITQSNVLTSGTEKSISAANSFVLEANDSQISISEIRLTYSCSPASASFDYTQTFNVENFESYTETGVGYDGSHSVASATNLRSAFYSTYNGSGTDPLNGSGWQVMGSSDYLTYNGSKGRNGSKCALFKVNSGNHFHYTQAKHYFGVPTAIGKGYKLSVWMHGGYSNTDMTTSSGYDTNVTLIAYYNKQLNTSGSNSAATATFSVPNNSDWGEYLVDLDPTKTVYAFGIYLKKATGTIYLPVDDVTLYSSWPYESNWPVGAYKTNVTAAGISMPIIFSFSDQRKDVAIRIANNTDPQITGYTYNPSTTEFSITTSGDYSGMTYGTITGKWSKANNRLTNVKLNGSISSYVSNNGSLTFNATKAYWNCDGTTSELQTTFKRRYSGTVDTTNADRLVSATWVRNSGTNSMKVRIASGYLVQVNLQQDINLSCSNIGFWVYTNASAEQTIRMWTYTGANLSNNAEIGSVHAEPRQWTFVCMGFNTKPLQLRNFQIAFDKWADGTMVFLDDICLYD